MSSLALTAYVLVWPAMASIVLAVLCVGVAHDMRAAKRNGTDLV
ncbi:MAG TPA: putative transporter small subunit [Pseudomonas sp.]|nr:putative transporter small subunit [Pseudomonas sp.]